MKKLSKSEVMSVVSKHNSEAFDMGLEVLGVFLQGSQNYQLDYEDSDIDTKAIIIPTMRNIVANKSPISTTHVRDNNEHIDLKDIRVMFNSFKKQNINFIEILFTDYMIINQKYRDVFQPILNIREDVARYNVVSAVNCMAGMSMEKYKALEHPYPATLAKIEKYGYDPKQLHHIVRMREFIERYIDGEDFASCLISKNKDYLIEVKKGFHTLEDARKLSLQLVEETKKIKDDFLKNYKLEINTKVDDVMLEVIYNACKVKFREELM